MPSIRKTLANLEREEKAIVAAFNEGAKHGMSMRDHLNNIRKNGLYEAVDCDNFEQYVKLQRIPLDPKHAYRLARCAEVAGHIQNSHVREFSDRALDKLGTIRVEHDDGTRSHDIDVPKLRRVVKRLTKDNRTLSDGNGEQITAPMVQKAIEDVLGEKPPKPLGEQLENKIRQVVKWHTAIDELDDEFWQDAEAGYPGCVTRLAQAYSRVASALRRKLADG